MIFQLKIYLNINGKLLQIILQVIYIAENIISKAIESVEFFGALDVLDAL